MNVLKIIASNSYITVNKALIKAFGLEAAVLLGELASESNYWGGEWFYSTVENIEERTTLNDYRQRKAIKELQKGGVIEAAVKGIPAKRYFRINEEQVFKILDNQPSNGCNTSSETISELGVKPFQTNKNREENIQEEKTKREGNASRSNAPAKHKHGEYKNVLLSDEELRKLEEEIPDYQSYIENLSGYIASTGKRYKSHYATIRQWYSRDLKSGKAEQRKFVEEPKSSDPLNGWEPVPGIDC